MFRQSVFIAIAFLATGDFLTEAKVVSNLAVQDVVEADPTLPVTDKPSHRYQTCSYIGDPHLLPFSQPYTQYWCKKSGWELLLSNKYVTLYVLVDSSNTYYRIQDYMLIFPEPTSCTTGTSSNPVPCTGSSSPIITQTIGNTYIHFHNSQELIIKIDYEGGYKNFFIWQSPKLVDESCGVCVRWNCDQEGLWMTPNPVVPQLCQIYADSARAHAIGKVDERIIELSQTQCINDVQTTFDPKAAETALTLVLQDGLTNLFNGDESQQALLEKVQLVKQEAIKNAETKGRELLANSKLVCNDRKICLSFDASSAAETTVKAKKK
ncbi:unnamed protein product [Adineta ricciae]|uniref:Uncharacterized protein n=1 Tax=Adineta ricciae TaxID=249248 RepID=A0A815KDS5_ADIRI|nr:unnamed protein product [Adineta ricciae]